MAGIPESVLLGLEEAGWDGEPLVAAVSGGGDSLAMAHALASQGLRPVVAHLDHGFRPKSSEDANFVADQARRLGLRFVVERVNLPELIAKQGGNQEEVARSVRYSFLARTLSKCGGGLITVAHTADDQAETVLHQILRGSAYPSGMKRRRGSVVRPMLALARRDLRSYLSSIGISPVEDKTNRDLARTRAWLRHDIIPQIVRRYPTVVSRLSGLAQVQQSLRADLVSRAEEVLDRRGVSVDSLLLESLALQRQVVAELLERAGAPVSFGRVEEILAAKDDGRARIQLSPTRVLRVGSGRLEVIATRMQAPNPDEVRVENSAQLPAGLPDSLLALWENLVIRHRRSGDRIKLSGGTRKLARWLIDKKVPREDRASLKVLASGSDVLWVQGLGGAKGSGFVDTDVGFMERALSLAESAAEMGELPVGAVVVFEGRVVGEGHNETEQRGDSTAHAEILALRAASRDIGDWRLTDASLYVTLEPCVMCFGAGLQSHLKRVVFGARNKREGSFGGVVDLNKFPWKRSLDIQGGILEEKCSKLITRFFEARRI
jgi:tRNA(Ile)-lysidine synthase